MAGLCSAADLPDEVLEEIFSRLPIESLIRFKCVNKSWYALINYLTKNPGFVNKQIYNMEKKISSPTCLVFCCPGPGYWLHAEMESLRRDLFRSITVVHGDNEIDDINTVASVFRLPTIPCEWDLAFAYRRHCNGIIWLAYGSTVVLCNPATEEWRILPDSCLSYRGFLVQGVGFGYDLKANDFKIVRFGHDSYRDGIDYFKTRAEVYSMRSDSWRQIEIQFKFGCSPFVGTKIGKEIYCKGVFYWSIQSQKHIILSFDMFDEVFRSIPLPDNLLSVQKDYFIRLAVWNETVALFFYKRLEEVTKSIEVWVMNDCCGGVKGSSSWSKKLTIRPPVGTTFPLAFLKNDDVLMEATDDRLLLYNVCSQTVKNLTSVGNTDMDWHWDFSYVKSLLSVQGGSQSHS